jgi:hypothetical protein
MPGSSPPHRPCQIGDEASRHQRTGSHPNAIPVYVSVGKRVGKGLAFNGGGDKCEPTEYLRIGRSIS